MRFIGKNATPSVRDHTSPVQGNDMVLDIPCVRPCINKFDQHGVKGHVIIGVGL